MRGTQLVQFHPSEPRFIPAGAGNTSSLFAACCLSAVYPRWRGEHDGTAVISMTITGLSPLARGTLQLDARMNLLTRFIPAGAGNTRRMIDEVKIQAVYPRWRGEHRILNRGGIHFGGLSPLARGTQSLLSQFYEQIRFIPAGAGNTPGLITV